jgi:hypothetical protein
MRMPEPRCSNGITSLLGCLALVGFITPPAACAEEVLFSGRADVGFHNQYNFRGFKAGDWAPLVALDLIIPTSADRSLVFDLGGWYVDPLDNSYSEIGLYSFLLFPLADFQLRVGGILFVFPNGDPITGEFGAAASYRVLDLVDLELAWWSDVKGDGFDEDELRFGHYAELKAGRSVELKSWLRVDLSVGVSYAIDYYGSDGWNHAFATLDFPIRLAEALTLAPYVGGTLALEGLKDAGERDQFLAGIRLSLAF